MKNAPEKIGGVLAILKRSAVSFHPDFTVGQGFAPCQLQPDNQPAKGRGLVPAGGTYRR